MSRSCGTCRWWARLNGRKHDGACHAVLPSAGPTPWPPTVATDWCVGWKGQPVCGGCDKELGVDEWLGSKVFLCAKCARGDFGGGEGEG